MHLQHVILATALSGHSIAAPAALPIRSAFSCVASLISPPPTNGHCGQPGSLIRPDPLAVAFNSTFDDCASSCLEEKSCFSLGYNDTMSSCQLYGKTLNGQGFDSRQPDAGVEYYAAGCFECASTIATSILSSVLPTSVPPTSVLPTSILPTTTLDTSTLVTSTIATSTLLTTNSDAPTPNPSSTTPTSTSTAASTTISATAYPTCTTTSVTQYGTTYTSYYTGSGFTFSNPAGFLSSSDLFYGWIPASQPCAAINACSQWTVAQNGTWSSFDLHLVAHPNPAVTSIDPVWECVAYDGTNVDPAAFSVANSSIVEVYGFSVGA